MGVGQTHGFAVSWRVHEFVCVVSLQVGLPQFEFSTFHFFLALVLQPHLNCLVLKRLSWMVAQLLIQGHFGT